jgi:hypothetical protein
VARLTEWITAWFGDIGCSMDPDGRCRGTIGGQATTPTSQLDVGCSMDPGGRCRDTTGSQPPAATNQLDVGCSLDPSGACGHHG